MNLNPFIKRSLCVVVCGISAFSGFAAAQRIQPTQVKVVVEPPKPMTVAGRNSLYCAGFVQSSPMNTDNQIVGAVEEQEQFLYAQNDLVYLNVGSTKGVNAGDMMAVVRPRGRVEARWTKKEDLGFFVQEVGAVEVIKVYPEVSVAKVKTSCDVFLIGDLVQPVPERTSPMHQARGPMEPYNRDSGKARGRLFMARDGQELITRDHIVYIDLGTEDNVQVGDRFTVFRPLGKGGLFMGDERESVSARDEGYQSNEFRGQKFSIQSGRKSGEKARGRVVTTESAKECRPDEIRKVVGELVILNVKEKTATAVVTRTVQEIHTGDWVELQ